ncbi:MAG TPA: YbaY family lipoprotein [Herpetosiphonaceae bacterium]
MPTVAPPGHTATTTAAPQPTPASQVRASGKVSGSMTYPMDRKLPPGATLTIRFSTVISDFGHERVIEEQAITSIPPSPVGFELAYDPATIGPDGIYTIRALMHAPGRLAWRSETHDVITQGAPSTVEMALKAPDAIGTVTGTLTYPGDSPLPPDAALTMRLIGAAQVANLDREVELSRFELRPVPAEPIPFLVEYDPAAVRADETYTLYAEIRAGGRLLFFTTELHPVITQGAPASVEVTLERPETIPAVTGVVTYPGDPKLPPDAMLAVQLYDLRYLLGDGEPILVAEQTIAPIGLAPIPFTIECDPATISPSGEYVIQAEIRADDRTIFSSQGTYPVIMSDHPSEVEIVLK